MSRSVLPISTWLGAVASCIIAPVVHASELTVTGRMSESVELNDNYTLSTPKSGVLGSYSTGSLSALYRTPTTRFTLNADMTYRRYFGPFANQPGGLSETLSDGANLRYENVGKLLGDRDYIFAGYRRSDAFLAQRSDLGFASTPVRGDLLTYTAGAGSARRLDNDDTVSTSVDYVKTTYSPQGSGNTPFSSISAQGGWSHQATHNIDINVAASGGFSQYENTANTEVTFTRVTGGTTLRLSNQLTVSGNAGAAMFTTKQDSTGPVVIVPDTSGSIFTPAQAVSGSVLGPVYDVSVNYKMFKSTTLSFIASQAISQGTLGDIAKRNAYTLSATHSLSPQATLSAFLGYSTYQPPAAGGGTPYNSINGSVSYSYMLSKEWQATLTYLYLQIDRKSSAATTSTTTGTTAASATANSIIFVLSKDFTLKP